MRSLARAPATTVAVLLVLGLGVGANLAIFSVVRASLITPLPYRSPDRLVTMSWQGAGGQPVPLSPAEVRDVREAVGSFEGVGAYHPWSYTATGFDRPERMSSVVVSAELFAVLGVEPALGRALEADGPEVPWQVVLSDDLWHRRFGADPSILGEKLVLDGAPATIVGVMAPGFRFPFGRQVDLWASSRLDAAQIPRQVQFLMVVARLAGGSDAAAAGEELDRLAAVLAAQFPDVNEGLAPRLVSLRESVVGKFEHYLVFLQAAVGLALLLACFNVAVLQLGRAEARRGEVAVRLALGAGQGHIVRLHLWENLVLGLGGGVLGVTVALLAVPLLVRFSPTDVHRIDNAQVGGPELVLALAAGVLSGLLVGQVPVWIQGRRRRNPVLGAGVRIGSGGTLRRLLVSAQVAVTLVLLLSFGLLLRSMLRLTSLDLGFEPDRVVSLGVTLPEESRSLERANAFYLDVEERLESLPGIEDVAVAVTPPLVRGFTIDNQFDVVGRPASPADPKRVAAIRPVGPGFFRLLGIPVLEGRELADADDGNGRPVAVANESFVRLFFGTASALGEHVRTSLSLDGVGRLAHDQWEIVGVVGDVRQTELGSEDVPALYFSTRQGPWIDTRILVKTARGEGSIAQRAAETVQAMVPDQPVRPPETLDQAAATALAPVRFQSGMLGLFAGFALFLMAVGLYGTLAYAVARRSREIGLRMALGAGVSETRWLVVRQALGLVAAGVLVGLGLSLYTGRLISSLLYGITSNDAVAYLGVSLILVSTALLASWLPARRATSLDPAQALRWE